MNHKDLGMVSELLEEMMQLLDESKSLVFTQDKRIVNAAAVYEIVDELRRKLPSELKAARDIVKDGERILSEARVEKERIIKEAKEHADVLVSRDEIVKTAQEKAAGILNEANRKATEKNRAATEFIDDLMREAEESISTTLNELKTARSSLKNPRAATGAPGKEEG